MSDDTYITYYAEHNDDPDSWLSPRPSFDIEGFNRELEKRGGLIGSIPRFRLRWGGDHEEYVLEHWSEFTGYIYRDANNDERFVSCQDGDFEFPDDCVPAPYFEDRKAFIPRWIIEEYTEPFYSKAWCIELLEKRFDKAGRIEMMSYYRAPAEIDLRMAEGVRHTNETLSAQDIIDAMAREAVVKAKAKSATKAEILEDMKHDAAKMIYDGVPGSSFISIPANPVPKNLLKEIAAKV